MRFTRTRCKPSYSREPSPESYLLAVCLVGTLGWVACGKSNAQNSSSPGTSTGTAGQTAGSGGVGPSTGSSQGGQSASGGTIASGAGTRASAGAAAGAAGSSTSNTTTAGGTPGGSTGSNTGGSSTVGGDAAVEDAASEDTGPSPTDASKPLGRFLHVEGNRLLDDRGKPARMTGVNWFGLETSNQAPHGTWARDYRSMLKQIRDLGFNSVRIPFSNAIQRPDAKAVSVNSSGADPYDGTDPMNKDLVGKSPMEILDLVIAAAGEFELRIILDNHSREPDGYMNEEVWYTAKTPEQLWISDWVALAKRYKGNPTVVAFDLDNEPHGKASWGTGVKDTDWNSAAERCGNAILAENPDVLIIVEGVSIVGTDTYWWGGNLSGVRTKPIVLSRPEKLVYSMHEYGPEVHEQPWFTDASFPNSLTKVWDDHFDFIMQGGLGHILIGEFGIKDRAAFSGKSGQWFDTLLKKFGGTYSWSFWCWNPNSGDTEGILKYDWLTPQQWKLDALKPYLAPIIGK